MSENSQVIKTITLGLKILFGLLSGAMIYLVITTSIKSNLIEALPRLNAEPWFVTTIIDYYFNVMILAAWVIYKEKKVVYAVLWIIAFIVLGSIASCFYILLQLLRLRRGESWDSVLLRAK